MVEGVDDVGGDDEEDVDVEDVNESVNEGSRLMQKHGSGSK